MAIVGRLCLAAAILGHGGFASVSFLQLPVQQRSTKVTARRSYIVHDVCPTDEGLGSTLHRLMPVIDVAERYNLTYVCRTNEFGTHGHATGNLGGLFGCAPDGRVRGNIAAYTEVKAALASGLLRQHDAHLVRPGSSGVHLDTAIEPGVVYHVNWCEKNVEKWGRSYAWFRSQYHMVRRDDARRSRSHCGLDASAAAGGRWRPRTIAVAIRRGDGNAGGVQRGFAVSEYVEVLDKLFAGRLRGVPAMRESEVNLVVIAETPEEDPEMRQFRKYARANVRFLLGEAETTLAASQARFVRDLDCLSTADVLLLSKGSFSSMAAALQEQGVALVLRSERSRNDMPNAVYVHPKRGTEAKKQ